MLYTIENDQLIVKITAKGAELASIVNKQTGLEYMWGAEPAWAKSSPVLFPIVGTLKDNTYSYRDKNYSLPRHGFARDEVFAAEQSQSNSVVLLLTATPASLEKYPFPFELRLAYELINNTVKLSYKVNNIGQEEMYFSLGAHPAFKAPLKDSLNYSDYYLQFNKKESAGRWPITKDGLIEAQPASLLDNTQRLDLTHELFYNDALVLKQLQSDTITLKSDKDSHGIDFHFEGFPFMGLWAARDANFICIEPWCGIADSVNHNQQFTTKEGIEKLAPGALWQRSWSVKCY